MKIIITAIAIGFCLISMSIHASNISDDAGITPKKYASILGKGFDVDWFRNGEFDAARYNDQAIADFKNIGIGNVRIRFQDNSLSDKSLAHLDHQIQWCIANGIVPIIAYQASTFKEVPTDENLNGVVRWWTVMAEHFKDASDSLAFDLIIEPSDAVKKDNDQLNKCYEKCVAAIRATNPHRIIFIAPNNIANPYYLDGLAIPSQANGHLMIEWHFYAAGPSKTGDTKLWTTGTDVEKKLLTDKIDYAMAWMEAKGLYSWVGAWMAGNYNKGDEYTLEEQQVFAKFMCKSLAKYDIPFSLNADKHFYDYSTNTWIEELIPLRNVIFGEVTTDVESSIPKSVMKRMHFSCSNGHIIASGIKGVDRIAIYRIAGQKLFEQKDIQSNRIDIKVNKGLYVIHVRCDGKNSSVHLNNQK